MIPDFNFITSILNVIESDIIFSPCNFQIYIILVNATDTHRNRPYVFIDLSMCF